MDGGGDIDFLIIGSTPMDNPAMIFGNPRPSQRVLKKGDIINMELAAGYRGYAAQIGSPLCLGEPPDEVRRFWDEIAKPGYELMVEAIGPGKPVEGLREAGRFFRERGVQSRPTHAHGIDLVSSTPHISTGRVRGEPFDEVFRPGNVIMAEPNPITADGTLGMFVGHTFIVTDDGRECLDDFPLELVVVDA
jgi:Xaa-Pro aminopeptidase